MSYIYTVDGILELEYTEQNLTLIFKRGLSNFSYHIAEDKGWNSIPKMGTLSPDQAAYKMLYDLKKDSDLGPIVKAVFDEEEITLHLFKTKLNKIKVGWSGLNPSRKKDFLEGEYGMDFAYYIEKFVDLYSEFNIISLEADYF